MTRSVVCCPGHCLSSGANSYAKQGACLTDGHRLHHGRHFSRARSGRPQRSPRSLHLLILTTNRHPVHVHWNRHDDLGLLRPSFPSGSTAPGPRALAPPVDDPGLDPLPLGPSVLEPDFHLDLAEFEMSRDVRSLGEGQVFFAVELLLELEQLLAGEGGAAASRLPAAAVASVLQPGGVVLRVQVT